MFNQRKLMAESLESRAMLAGNIHAYVDGGSLIIKGDIYANAVSIQQVDVGKYAVTGSAYGVGGTTINGTFGAKVFSGVINDFNIDLGGGDDALFISQDAVQQGNWAATYGTGPVDYGANFPNPATTDSIRTVVPRNLFVYGSIGNDAIATNVRVGRDGFGGVAIYDGSNGNDQFQLERSIYKSTLVVNGQNDNDDVRVNNVGVGGTANFNTHAGNDLIQLNRLVADTILANTGDANDRGIVVSNSHSDGDMVLLTENGSDAVDISDSSIGGNLVVNTGVAADTITANNLHVDGDVNLNGGDGNDSVTANNVNVVDDIFLYLGAGNDTVHVSNSSADALVARGGSGFDQYFNDGGNSFNSTDVAEFE